MSGNIDGHNKEHAFLLSPTCSFINIKEWYLHQGTGNLMHLS